MCNTKNKPKVSYGLWVSMCQHTFIFDKKRTILLSDTDNGGGHACVGEGGIWEISIPSLQYCSETKIALKINS